MYWGRKLIQAAEFVIHINAMSKTVRLQWRFHEVIEIK